jgi:hypothetical protein
LPSAKYRVFARGTAYTGTAGVGFISLDPRATAANDQHAIRYTSASYAGTTIVDGTNPGVSTAVTNAPYASAQIDPDIVQYRVVGCGLRVRYGGTELNRGGFKIAFVDPTHRSVETRDEASLLSEPQAKKLSVTRNWTNLLYRPVLNSDISFNSNTTPDAPYMAVMLVSPDTSIAELFEWEVYSLLEYQGASVRGQTHTNADPVGFAAVSAVANQTNGVMQGNSAGHVNQMMKAVHHYLGNGISGVVDVAQTIPKVANTAMTAMDIFEDVLEIGLPLLALL